MVKNKSAEEWRWEYCTECTYGFPEYRGLSVDKKFHTFVCGNKKCETYYRVEVGRGNYDLRLGIELSEKSIYYEICDGCRKSKPVKVHNLAFLCKDCGK